MNTLNEPASTHLRSVRSFVRREGRLTSSQARALDLHWGALGLEPKAGVWNLSTEFARSAPTVLEIGCGNGDYLLARARSEPDKNFIGVEVHRPGVGRILHHAAAEGLSNLRVVCHDAVEILREHIAAASLSQVVIYFPDPWHKTRHHKRRLVQTTLIDVLADRIQSGGTLLLATDWAPYAEQMLEVINPHPEFQNCASDQRFVPRPPERPLTRFEARGLRLGHDVFDLAFMRRLPNV